MYLSLWESDNHKELIVEIQRRRGDAAVFYPYAQHILDAASGQLDSSRFSLEEGSLQYLKSTESKLKTEISRQVPASEDMEKESVVALEIVHGLLKKDRMDARHLGMESVSILANCRKTVLSASILMSRALLLGNGDRCSQGLNEMLLNVLQKRSIGIDESFMGGDYPTDDDEDNFFVDQDPELEHCSPEYKEEMTLLFNLGLDALAHALEVATTFDLGVMVSSTTKQDISPHYASSVVDTFLVHSQQRTDVDMLITLLQTLQRAPIKPHNAWLAAKCLRYICSASPHAAQRTEKLGGADFCRQAYEVGIASHAKLEYECRLLQGVFSK